MTEVIRDSVIAASELPRPSWRSGCARVRSAIVAAVTRHRRRLRHPMERIGRGPSRGAIARSSTPMTPMPAFRSRSPLRFSCPMNLRARSSSFATAPSLSRSATPCGRNTRSAKHLRSSIQRPRPRPRKIPSCGRNPACLSLMSLALDRLLTRGVIPGALQYGADRAEQDACRGSRRQRRRGCKGMGRPNIVPGRYPHPFGDVGRQSGRRKRVVPTAQADDLRVVSFVRRFHSSRALLPRTSDRSTA